MAFIELGHSELYYGTIDSIIHISNDLTKIVFSTWDEMCIILQV